MVVVVTGSHGMIASFLVPVLEHSGATVIRMVRSHDQAQGAGLVWDPNQGIVESNGQLPQIDAVINLAGAPIAAERWNPIRKREIYEGRIQGTRGLVDWMTRLPKPPTVFLSASATGYYGDRGTTILPETASKGRGFLSDTSRDWENEALRAESLGVRVVTLRFSAILSRYGGLLERLVPVFKSGAGGRLGDGRQIMSWASITDTVQIIMTALHDQRLMGPLNVASPNAVENREFTKALGKAVGRPTFIPIPKLAIRTTYGEMADELLLASCYAVPEALRLVGYRFLHPNLGEAMTTAMTLKPATIIELLKVKNPS